LLLPTLRENPADAEVVSHQLMLRAGLIRQVASGVYNWLPLGLRVLRRVETIVREEMNAAGAQELFMPAVQPAELWQQSGRWDKYGPELLRLKDRHQRDFCFGPTHEEVITALARNEIRSYRQLPQNFYQIQTKFRDEIRPRFGVMRAREFLMKDAYSFHASQASLNDAYDAMHAAYSRIFERLGLRFRAVEADSGAIGGNRSHEFHVLADSGEDAIAVCDRCDYAANVELAPALPPIGRRPPAAQALRPVATPAQRTIAEVSGHLGVDPSRIVKTLLVRGTGGVVALVLRGDHELNPIKADKHPHVAKPLEFIGPGEAREIVGCEVGFIGPLGLTIPVIADESAARLADFICGANQPGEHLAGVNWGRDLPEPEIADLRKVVDGDPCPRECAGGQGRISLQRGIEVGHVFQLGSRYSEAMGATFLDEAGSAAPLLMGCYGIGVSRVVAAAIEQNHDDKGIVWPDPIAPFQAVIIPIGSHRSPAVAETAERLRSGMAAAGWEVLLDDREERPGVLFADADLIGIPHRLVIGEKGLAKGTVEHKHRRSGKIVDLGLDDLLENPDCLNHP
jgi:prolyl-tRNA synthetase